MNSAPTNIGVVNLINSLPTLTPVSFQNESNFPKYRWAIYANFTPWIPNFINIAITANVKGIIPISKISSNSISNCSAMNRIGINVAGIAIILQFIWEFFLWIQIWKLTQFYD